MTIFERYIRYFSEVCEQKRTAPEGFPPSEAEHPGRAILEFVQRCAADDGECIPQEELDAFDPAEVERLLQQAMNEPQQTQEPQEERVRIEEPDGPRHACEVLLDCCLLDDNLFTYLVETLKTGDEQGFYRLSQVATRQSIPPKEFLRWLGTKEQSAEPDEQACVAIMDAVLERLAREGELELLAALISGDKKTFELFRCEAPELVHLPQATYGWYEQNYLNRYSPVRFMMRRHGVVFPECAEG